MDKSEMLNPLYNTKIVLLTGAGASASFEMPTMKDVIDKLKLNVAQNNINLPVSLFLEQIIATLEFLIEHQETKQVEEMVKASRDLEEIYVCCQKLEAACEIIYIISKSKELYGALLAEDTDDAENIKRENFRAFIEKLQKCSKELRVNCERMIYDCWGQLKTDKKDKTKDQKIVASNIYKPLLLKLLHENSKEQKSYLPIFTTNYDSSIRDVCYNIGIHLIDGLEQDKGDPQIYVWNADNYQKSYVDKNNIMLFNLHGSSDWIRRGDDIIRFGVSEYRKDDNIVIYPKKDKLPIKEPFFTNYDCLGRYLDNAEFLVVIGYSFRDFGIVARIKSAARYNPKLKMLIIDPFDDIPDKEAKEKDMTIELCCPVKIIPRKFDVNDDDQNGYLSIVEKLLHGETLGDLILREHEHTIKIDNTEFEKCGSTPDPKFENGILIVNPDRKGNGGIVLLKHKYSNIVEVRLKYKELNGQFGIGWMYKNENALIGIYFTNKFYRILQINLNNGPLYTQISDQYISEIDRVKNVNINPDGEFILTFEKYIVRIENHESFSMEIKKDAPKMVSNVGFCTFSQENKFYDIRIKEIS